MLKHNSIIEASDVFVIYATFSPLFVSIKVSDCISLSNLVFSVRRPADAVCMPPMHGSKALYKPRLGHLESHSSCKLGDGKLSAAQREYSVF